MAEERSAIDKELDGLRRLRDELNVQAHLGRAEVKELWDEAERRWHRLEGEADRLREQAGDSLEQIGEAAELLVDEIKGGYEKLRKLL